jgi:transcriptional regulator with GAF, ATPase, and Fis domain
MSLEEAESEFNRDIILNALEKSDYVQSRAAKMLGITRRILKYKMDKLGISSPDEEAL